MANHLCEDVRHHMSCLPPGRTNQIIHIISHSDGDDGDGDGDDGDDGDDGGGGDDDDDYSK